MGIGDIQGLITQRSSCPPSSAPCAQFAAILNGGWGHSNNTGEVFQQTHAQVDVPATAIPGIASNVRRTDGKSKIRVRDTLILLSINGLNQKARGEKDIATGCTVIARQKAETGRNRQRERGSYYDERSSKFAHMRPCTDSSLDLTLLALLSPEVSKPDDIKAWPVVEK